MSIVKEIDDLHIESKWLLANIASTLPFFFVIFYLFNYERIKLVNGNPFIDLDFYYILSVCFCLSIVWFMMNFLISSIIHNLLFKDEINQNNSLEIKDEKQNNFSENETIKNTDKDKSKNDLKDTYIITYIYSVIYLSFAIFMNHMYLNLSFRFTIIMIFSFIILRLMYVFLIDKYLMELLEKLTN